MALVVALAVTGVVANEVLLLYLWTAVVILAHIHYGVSVVSAAGPHATFITSPFPVFDFDALLVLSFIHVVVSFGLIPLRFSSSAATSTSWPSPLKSPTVTDRRRSESA